MQPPQISSISPPTRRHDAHRPLLCGGDARGGAVPGLHRGISWNLPEPSQNLPIGGAVPRLHRGADGPRVVAHISPYLPTSPHISQSRRRRAASGGLRRATPPTATGRSSRPQARLSPRLPTSPHLSPHLHTSPRISPHLPTSPHISPTSPHISPHLPHLPQARPSPRPASRSSLAPCR